MTNKKLGLLLAPLIPLTAIGIVEVANAIVVPAPAITEARPIETAPSPHLIPVAPKPPAPVPAPVEGPLPPTAK